jgi:hydrogenase expression/formation protein HypC
MCLGIPGKVIDIQPNAAGITMGKVDFGGIVKEICLAYVPDVKIGEYVIAHAGFAINTLDEKEALEVFETLKQMDELAELRLTTNDE